VRTKISGNIILKAIKEGDAKSFLEVLYKREYPKVKSYIYKNNGSEEEAKDVFQEALMVLVSHVKLGKFKEQYEVGAFIFSVARNAWRKRAPKINSQEELEEVETFSYSPYEEMFNKERKQVIGDLLEKLGENCKNILVASMYHGLSLKEIAEEYNYGSVDVVKTRTYKCKKRLSELISRDSKLESYLKETLK